MNLAHLNRTIQYHLKTAECAVTPALKQTHLEVARQLQEVHSYAASTRDQLAQLAARPGTPHTAPGEEASHVAALATHNAHWGLHH